MIYPPTLAEALDQSEVLFDRAQLQQAIRRVAADIDAALDGERALYLTVMHGALIFAAELSLEIKTDIEFDYVHATRYRGAIAGSDLHWMREPQCDMQGRTVLLVDDILDEGHTLKSIREHCLARGAKRVLIVTLCSKLHDRRTPGIEADFNGVDLPDRYVFGYGMDYKEQGRNLPAIYAFK